MPIYELEDRIYFDGAIPADVAEVVDTSCQDAENTLNNEDNSSDEQSNENFSIAPAETMQDNGSGESKIADGNSDSHDRAAEPDIVSADNTDEIILSLAGIEDIEIPEGYEIPSNVLILSSECSNYNEIINSVKENTIIIEYDSNDTFESVLQELKEVLADKQAVNIGIIESENLELSELSTSSGLSEADFMNELSDLQTIDGVINEIDLESVSTDAQDSVFTEYFDISSPEFDTLCESMEEPTEIIFINSSVMNAEEIVDDLPENAEIVYLESGENGIQQITDYLADKTDIDTIRIISHGNDGYIVLNGEIIDADYLAENSDVIAAWKNALSENADIMLYGCNVAGSEAGEAFVQQLGILTGADVAAATFNTGGTETNWNLNYTYGEIEAVQLSIDGYEFYLASHTVTNNLDDGSSGTLGYEITNAASGDEIIFSLSLGNETIVLLSQISITKSLTLNGDNTDGSGINVSIQSQENGAELSSHRVFHIDPGAAENVYLENMTIKGGDISAGKEYGGSIYLNSGSLYMDACTVTGSKAYMGGGIYTQGALLDINNSTISYNEATINVSGFSNGGGGIYYDAGVFHIRNSNIFGNISLWDGGGILVDYNATTSFTIEYCTIYNNTAVYEGGGLYIDLDTHTGNIVNTTIANNTAALGGGLYFWIDINNDYLIFQNCTVAHNTATEAGGGVFLRSSDKGKFTIYNSVLADNFNSSTNTTDDFHETELVGLEDFGYNIVGVSNHDNLWNVNGDWTDQNGDGIFVQYNTGDVGELFLASELSNNGGPTMTLALSSGSIAINAIPKAAEGDTYNNSPNTDQRGYVRIGEATCIGAYITDFIPTYYRTVENANGSWTDITIWEASENGISNWIPASAYPTYIDNTITVRENANIYFNSDTPIDQTIIENGVVFIIQSDYTMIINDGSETDLLNNGSITVNGAIRNSGEVTNSGTITVPGIYIQASTNSIIGNAIEYTGSNSSLVYSGITMTATSGEFNTVTGPANLTITDSANITLDKAKVLSGNITIENGSTLDVSSSNYTVNIAGNWSNSGHFNANSGEVVFEGTGESKITGSTEFYNFSCRTAGKPLKFDSTDTALQTVLNLFTLIGSSNDLITIASTTTLEQACININSSNVSYVKVFNSYNKGTEIIAKLSKDGGNNYGWIFSTPSPSPTRPDVNNGGMINDGTQFQTRTSWRNSIDSCAFDSIDSDEGFEPNEVEGIGLMMNSLIIFDVSVHSVANGEYSIGAGSVGSGSSYDGEYGISGKLAGGLMVDGEYSTGLNFSGTGGSFGSEYEGIVDLSFDLETADSLINFERIAIYNERHPLFKSELELILEKI